MMYTFLREGVTKTLDAMHAGAHAPQSFLEAELMRYLRDPQPRFVWGTAALAALEGAPELERSANQARALTRALKELVNEKAPQGELEASIRVALIGRNSQEHARFWALRHDWARAVPVLERELERCAREVHVKCFATLAFKNQELWDALRNAWLRTRDEAYRAQIQQVLNALSAKRAYGAASKATSYAEYQTLVRTHGDDLRRVLSNPATMQIIARLGGLQLPTETEILQVAGVWLERIAAYDYFVRWRPALSPFQQVREREEYYAAQFSVPSRRNDATVAGVLSAIAHSASAPREMLAPLVRTHRAGFINLHWRVPRITVRYRSAEDDLKVERTARWYRHHRTRRQQTEPEEQPE